MKSLRRTLETKQLKLLQKITTLNPWIEGSLVSTSRFCGKKNCACHHGGSKHPVLYVTWKEKGKNRVPLYPQKTGKRCSKVGTKLSKAQGTDPGSLGYPETNRASEGGQLLINLCPQCFKKQRKIDELTEEIQRLRQKLSYRTRQEKEGFFGSSTSSAKLPLKPNTAKTEERKPKGARPGHRGAGRKGADSTEVDRVVSVDDPLGNHCPSCGGAPHR